MYSCGIENCAMGIIYMFTSKTSGKSYIGQTTYTFEHRVSSHKSASGNLKKKDGCRHLNNAIRLYGWEDFSKEIIWECYDEDLDFWEEFFIESFGTLNPGGYNLITGGSSNKRYSEETKQKMREKAQNRDTKAYRKKPGSENLPKYLLRYKDTYTEGYKIAKHPNCSCKYFNDKTKTMDELLQEALQFLNDLNNGIIVVEKKQRELPEHLQYTKGGYRAHFRNKNGIIITKLFTNQKIPLETRFEQAIEYINSQNIDK